MTLQIDAVRAQFPALSEGAAHFDAPGGSLVPLSVSQAVRDTLASAVCQRGVNTIAERRTDAIVLSARQAIADLLGANPGGVVFGRSMTQLTFDFSRTIAKTWGPGDEIVVSRLDHDANIRPWLIAAQSVGVEVRWIEFDPETSEITVDDVEAQLTERTRLVAITAASNLIGTRPPIKQIAQKVHERGALLYVDGVHNTAHSFVDVAEMGADVYCCSPYKFCGPHLGVLVAAPQLLETLHPDKLLPSVNTVPEKFELGTPVFELLAGTTAAVDFLAGLAGDSSSSRRERLERSAAAMGEHEDALRRTIEAGLAQYPRITVYSRAQRRTPTLLFTVDGIESSEISARLGRVDVNVPASNFYALEASRRLGLGDAGGIRIGLAPYSSSGDVDRLLEALGEIV
ncbi:MAG: cysteine desulfurase-like protein [Actinobacteria bacterium HGW-Actinobacteria-7]|jgi:cysteine desulfurase family protein (TIGR01976 family)|nr:MAG: cysteine desulfurase-like protein [Actinobacteria bacterium HGW-Actinobacteria-7]